MEISPSTKIVLKESPVHGFGVFATQLIEKGEIIEVCPFIVFPHTRFEKIPVFQDYSFCWPRGEEWTHHAIVMGFGSYYNHSDTPNASWDTDEKSFIFYALKQIQPSEEIFTNYSNGSIFNL